jgi:lysine-specific demethylase 8
MSEESLRIEPEAHQSLFRDALPIPRLDAQGDWDELSADGTPFILTGRTAGWRSRTWSFEHFRETYGAASILTSRNARNSAVSYYWPPDCHRISTTCRDFVDAMLDHPEQEIYLWKRTIEQFPGLNEDFSFEQIKPGRGTPTYTNIWLSTAGSRSGLHFDRHDNIFAQMVGQKSVLLLPPEEASRIYPFHDFIERSRIDPEYVDVHLFPKA